MNLPNDDLSFLDRMDGVGSPRRRLDPSTGHPYKPNPNRAFRDDFEAAAHVYAVTDPTDEELDAALAQVKDRSHQVADPGTSEKTDPWLWSAFSLGVLLGLAGGFGAAIMVGLTSVVIR